MNTDSGFGTAFAERIGDLRGRLLLDDQVIALLRDVSEAVPRIDPDSAELFRVHVDVLPELPLTGHFGQPAVAIRRISEAVGMLRIEHIHFHSVTHFSLGG
jgi:hypothetical protein